MAAPSSPNLPTALLLNGREFTYADIREYPARLAAPVNGYEAKVLDFVRQWLTGTQEFHLTTSGSTGVPTPLTLRRRQLEASARRTGDYFDLGPGDRALVCLNCEYIGGLMMLVRGLERHLHLTIVAPLADPLALVGPEDEKPTDTTHFQRPNTPIPNTQHLIPTTQAPTFDFTAVVPLQLRAMLAAGRAPRLNQLRTILVGGAPVDAALQALIDEQLTAPVYLTYGMTETVSHVALRRLNGPEASADYRVLPGIAAGTDARGCLTLRGDVTDDQLLITNDLVRLAADGHSFTWLGRADFVINSGGVKVPAEKVELVLDVALVEIGAGRHCFVTGLPDERLGEQVAAIIEGQPLTDKEEARLQALLAARLAPYERPRQLRYVPAFVRTASGKLGRAATLEKL